MSDVIKADIYNVVSDNNIPWNGLRNSTVLVTGATGLIGGALIGALSSANVTYALNLRIIVHGRNRKCIDFLVNEYGIEFISGDIRKSTYLSDTADEIDYIFHCAAVTKSAEVVAKPVDVSMISVLGTRNMLELAKTKKVKGFMFLSSMEAYGQANLDEVKETDLGYLDLTNPRSSYPESKRFCEMLCVSYATQYHIPVKIARLAQTFGAWSARNDSRVFAQFARSALAGQDIELHTEGKSRGNYCYISDTVRGVLTVLLKGETGEIYNIANPKASVTIREMAMILANEIFDGKVKVVVKIPEDIEKRGYAPDANAVLNVDKLMALGWKPGFELADMYRRMIAYWQGR